jgi:hypothetical protein
MPANIYAAFETDPEKEASGTFVELGPFRFKLARAGGGNRRFKALVEKKMKPHVRLAEAGLMPEGAAVEILAECFAETVVLDWENVTDREGNVLPFSPSACKKLLVDLPELFTELRAQAEKASNFLSALREADSRD